jgi:Glycosyltransferase
MNTTETSTTVLPAAPDAAPRVETDAQPPSATFDGIICFGGVDWWYHNRGHYDLQMMRELSGVVPVLYINSIGMRVSAPGQHSQLAHRIGRKVRSVLRGRVRVNRAMTVYSPFAPPVRFGRSFVQRALSLQVRSAARALRLRRPLVWVACPSALDVIDALDPAAVVYQRTDRYEEYPGVNRARVESQDRALKRRADLTLFCSSAVMDEEKAHCRRALFADHGVDFTHFAQAGDARAPLAELTRVPSPRIGYVGNLEPHRVDHRLLAHIAHRLPDIHLVIVGPGTIDPALAALPNVHRFPQQPYEKVARFTASCDVLIMPWCDNAWIRACNPIKLKEYLAVGRPVVTTAFDELRRYEGYVRVARDYDTFVEAIRIAIRDGDSPHRLRARVQHETWSAKAALVLDTLRDTCGLSLAR